MRRTRHFGRIVTRFVLVVVFVIACVAIPVTISRYIQQEKIEDNATAATFEITHESNFVKTYIFNVDPYGNFTQDIWLTNKSEVDIHYTVVAELKYQVIPGMTCEVVKASGDLEPGQQVKDIDVKVTWPDSLSFEYSNIVDVIKVTVICEQVD